MTLEAVEVGLKAALFRDGTRLLATLLNGLTLEGDVSRHGEECQGKRALTVQTVLGPVELRRNYYHDPQMHRGRIPLDEALGFIDGYSPGMARMMCWAGAQSSSFPAGSEALRRLGGVEVEARQIQRMTAQMGPRLAEVLDRPWQPVETPPPTAYVSIDATGVPMIRAELQGRSGKQPDGSAKTREVKLACFFTQQQVDDQGRPWRDLDSTTYVAAFETASDFAHRIRREAQRRRFPQAGRLVILADGAPWIWELARTLFPEAVQILDFYHACEHLKLLAEALEPSDPQAAHALWEHWKESLKLDQLDQVVAEALSRLPRSGLRRQEADRQLAYLENNRHRMAYGTFQKKGWFIGSGVVEAGCKTVIGQRLKQSGMFWSVPGAQNILTLRCATSSRRFDEAWSHLPIAA